MLSPVMYDESWEQRKTTVPAISSEPPNLPTKRLVTEAPACQDQPSQRNMSKHFVTDAFIAGQCLTELGLYDSWTNTVDSDILHGNFVRNCFRQTKESSLAHRISSECRESSITSNGRYVDNGSSSGDNKTMRLNDSEASIDIPSLFHQRNCFLRQQKCTLDINFKDLWMEKRIRMCLQDQFTRLTLSQASSGVCQIGKNPKNY